jgi:hypothetical protein
MYIMKKRGLFVALGIIAVLLVLAVIGGVVIWLRIEGLKNQLAENIGRALGAKVEVTSLNLDLWKGELHAAGITLSNEQPEAPWDRGEIGQATVRFHLKDFFAPIQPLSVEVTSWRVVLRPGAASGEGGMAAAPASMEETPAPPPQNLARHGVEVTQLTAREGEVEIDLSGGRQVLVHGVGFEAKNNEGTWTAQLQAASIDDGSLQTGPASVELRADTEKIAFSTLRVQCDPGMITGEGERALGGAHASHATLQGANVPVAMLVSTLWQMKLSGLATGNLAYQGDDQTADAQGQITLQQGKFNVLPALGKLATLIGLPDITGVEVDKATANFDWKDHALHLTQIDVRKNDVTRVAGDVDVDASGQVDGRLKLGFPDSLISRWPQLQTAVFSSQSEDYGWTDVHLTGTPDHLQEDLTPRLLAAGIQSGGSLINQGAQKAMDLWKSVMGP